MLSSFVYLEYPSSPSPNSRANSSNSFVSFTTSIPFTSNSLQPYLHNGSFPTPLPSIHYAPFSSPRRVYPPFPSRGHSAAAERTKAQIYRRRSPFHSTTYNMLPPQLLSFVLDPFSWGGVPPPPRRSDVETFGHCDVPTFRQVPLPSAVIGATIRKGTRFLH
jgi:hypothetical protein